ncbi:undecaprenyl-phosphate galactose phosphotransferase WbaP [Geobacter benzoatilyticus]|uniref:Undecaprenyl-phosphate galactose phosphotransferase WbaP n=2 Tax=Geobacter benzoatilyticus TaxID=2815309 RepID=A0ABX7Q1C4_9BACT|nr:undecaprenyl-phosphate galactose phosphotransferase WbaP [Geobacter benzoatilyticus]
MIDMNTSQIALRLFYERKWVKWVKVSIDILSLQIALVFVWMVCSYFSDWFQLELSAQTYWDLSIALLLIPLTYWLMKLYPGYGLATVERFRRRVRATFIFFVGFISWDFLVNCSGRSMAIILLTFMFALILPPIFQYLGRRLLLYFDCWGMPVIILGAGKTGEQLVRNLISDKNLGLRPIAVLDDDESRWGESIVDVPIVGGFSKASEFNTTVTCAFLAIPGAGRCRIAELVRNLPFSSVVIIPDLSGIQSLWVEVRDLDGVVGLELKKKLLQRSNWYFKRFMDYFIGLPLFILSIPVYVLAALWIVIVSPGNPFYCQVREGVNGIKFKVWKLRTMYPQADKLLNEYLESNPAAKTEWNTYFKLKNDPRIIRGIGSILRKTSLDELPQLWNVLKGEMSLVGPRPFPHYHLERFDEDFRCLRRSVLPGMTGLWQVSARSDGDLQVQESLDTYYIRNWSIWLDVYLLGRTFAVVLSGKGAY